jgi:hypothetical protein
MGNLSEGNHVIKQQPRDGKHCTIGTLITIYRDCLLERPDAEGGTGLIHIEYQSGTDGALEFLKIWESTVWGVWNLMCELWTHPRWSHATGIRFGRYSSLED